MKYLHTVAFILLLIGGLNWGIYGLLDTDVVMWLLGSIMGGLLVKGIYVLVGIAAVYEAVSHKERCKECMSSTSGSDMKAPSMQSGM